MTGVVVCLDEMDPTYFEAVETPGWDDVASEGTAGECDGVVPSLANVNNVSIVTGAVPSAHGVTGNTYYERERDVLVYMVGPSFLRCETRLELAAAGGLAVAALVAKEKLRGMVGRGCDVAASAEDPPAWLEAAVGPAPDIYSGEASSWLLSAAEHVLSDREPDLLYVSTTDVVPHKHAPESRPSGECVRELDAGLPALRDRCDALVATADHGMNHKTLWVDLDAVLEEEGVEAEVVRLIRDRHTSHHQNLGGAANVYVLDHPGADLDWLYGVEGVDDVLDPVEAADRYRLPADHIGDALVLGTRESVFVPIDVAGETRAAIDLRSHGSHHEQTVPHATTVDARLAHNLDAFDTVASVD